MAHHNTLPITLHGLSNGNSNVVALAKIVDTIWAITNFIYTGDNTVEFVRLDAHDPVQKSLSVVVDTCYRSYTVAGTMSAIEIEEAGKEVENIEDQSAGFDHGTRIRPFVQLIKQATILLSSGGQTNSALAHAFEQNDDNIVFSVALREHGVQSTLSFPCSQQYDIAARCIADTIQQIGQSVLANWTSPLNSLNSLGPINSDSIMTTAVVPTPIRGMCLGDIVRQQAFKRPNLLAIDAWDGTFTYSELYKQACHMAGVLLKNGIAKEEPVMFCLKKSKWAIVAVFGILLAGGTCVPVDVKAPAARVESLVERVKARFVLTDKSKLSFFEVSQVQTILCPETLESVDEEMPVLPTVLPTDRAYIFFTSGSTGTPKGVVGEHGAYYTALEECSRAFKFDETARIFQYTAYVFDMSMADIHSGLIAGSCICIPSEEQRMDDLSSAVQVAKATHIALTKTVLAQIQPADVPTLRHLFTGGESMDKALFNRWRSHVDLNVIYGTTESIVWDTITSAEELMVDYSSLGRAMGPCLWVVDVENPEQIKPVGALGEIIVEGPSLARCYLGDAVKTTEKFIASPTWLRKLRQSQQGPVHKCYRTGDIGVRNADGTVSFIGRVDFQVKIRGQRVELGEIEQSLKLAEPRFEQVAVELLKVSGREDSKILVAFTVTGTDGDGIEKSTSIIPMDLNRKEMFMRVRRALAESLPLHMIPALFIPVHSFPRSVGGKLDRNVLKAWFTALDTNTLATFYLFSTSSSPQPETKSEKVLQQVWTKVLGIPDISIGVEDNFFQIGGDSVLAMQMVSDLRDKGYVLTASQIFQQPRLAEMAAQMVYGKTDESSPVPFGLIRHLDVDKCLYGAARACQLSATAIQDIYPATPMQEALLAASAHRQNIYRYQGAFKLDQSIELGRFQAAWETLAANQAIFRTRIVVVPEAGTLQVVVRSNIRWRTGQSLQDYLQYDRETPLTYGTDLSRYAIITDNGATYFVWSGHHAIYDGWSQEAMFSEFYRIYCGGIRPQVPYTNFVQYLRGHDTKNSDGFWQEQFHDAVESFPQLPSAGYAPQPQKSKTLDIELSPRAGSTITTATLIKAAWGLVTAKYADVDEVVFGVTLSGRDIPVSGVTKIMGPTITTVPFRINIDQTKTIAEFLEEVQSLISQVKQHQHAGLQRIRQLTSGSEFQNLLVVQPAERVQITDLCSRIGLDLVHVDETDSKDLALTTNAFVNTDNVRIHAQYDSAVIHDDQLERFLHLFKHVMTQLETESEELTIYDLDMMSPFDLQQLNTWNKAIPSALDSTIHGLFEQRVLDTPDRIATSGFDGGYTYAELNDAANGLAGHLMGIGVGPEVFVTLCFSKSTVAIIAMLAVMKAGGVCVAVNPQHPTDRLLELAAEVSSPVVLCDESDVARFVSTIPTVLRVNVELLTTLKVQVDTPRSAVTPENAAMVVFTSGSTGKPKASVLEHRNLATSLLALVERLGLNQSARMLQFSAYTFDYHILEIFGTLAVGGRVCVISDSERMDQLAETIGEQEMNWACLTPTVARLLSPENVPTLRTIVFSGEPLAPQDVQIWSSRVRMLNGMGPSECSIMGVLTKQGLTPESDPCNLGHPVGCHVWITDKRRKDRLAPIGCVGEMTFEGPIIGRGYINRKQAMAAAFIKNPAWSRDGSGRTRRFYRTGDMGRLNPDGSITFVSRGDTQVKIRGQRVELGEIEHRLKLCGRNLEQVVVDVLAIASRGNTQTLAAFILSRGHGQDNKLDNTTIRPMSNEYKEEFSRSQKELSTVLPRYMVPRLFFPISKLPISPSGKLERKILKQWVAELTVDDLAQYYLTESIVLQPPTTVSEKRLQALWARVLKVPEHTIGATDNFFQLGGDSVMAMELVAVARAAGIALTVAELFASPILRDMAQSLAKSCSTVEAETVVEAFALVRNKASLAVAIEKAADSCNISSEMIEDMYPCTPMQEALIAVSAHLPKSYTYQAVFKLPKSCDLDLHRFKAAWDTVVAGQPIFRTRIVFVRGVGTVQIVLRRGINWLHDNSLERYLQRDRDTSIGYGGDLCHFAIVEEKDNRHFVWTAHHSIYDGFSLPVLFNEIRQIYDGKLTHSTAPPFNNFIRYLDQVNVEESDDFWRNQFPEATEQYPRLPHPGYLPQPRQTKVHNIGFGNRADTTITMATVIQAAWGMVTAGQAASNGAALFGLTLSGRDVPVTGVTDMMGPTLTTVPLRIPIKPTQDIAGFLHDVQVQVALLRKYQHAGLQRIRRLSPVAREAVTFQNLLIIQTNNELDMVSTLSGLGLQPVTQGEEDFLDLALTVECVVQKQNIRFTAQYDNNVVPDAQMDLLLHQLEHTLSLLTEKPGDTLLQDLDMASTRDVQQVIDWNGEMPTSFETTVHEMVEAQVMSRPNAIAYSSSDGVECTYSELDRKANLLAARLAQLGVGPEIRVMLAFSKSTWPIVALYAILKCGGACVSVGVDHPLSHLTEIATETEATILLCDKDKIARFQGLTTYTMVVDAALFVELESRPSHVTRVPVSPDNAAFIIYTSGSTGKPKGSCLEHRAVCTSLYHNGKNFDMGPKTRVVQFSSYTFDHHMYEIFATLMLGGCVCVPTDFERMNALGTFINKQQVNWAFLTPTVSKFLIPAEVPSLSTLAFGGERLLPSLLETWGGKARLFNGLGPSECTVVSVAKNDLDENTDPMNLGRPVGCHIWITEHGRTDRLVPIGCVGEMTIEGPNLGRGYVNRPDLTAKSWIMNPAWSRDPTRPDQSRRFYRSGDLAKYNADGTITVMGRADTQVKVHGQRVELGEIEHHLRSAEPNFDIVAAEIVTVPSRTSGLLVAFVSYVESSATKPADTQAFMTMNDDLKRTFKMARQVLSDSLPRYMIPTMFVPVRHMPHSLSNKLDRKLLRQWLCGLSADDLAQYYINDASSRAAETDQEKYLQQLWARLLEVPEDNIGVEDHFFRVGGDSVMAMELAAMLRESGRILTVAQMFEFPRLCEMAAVLGVAGKEETDSIVQPFDLMPIKYDMDTDLNKISQACQIDRAVIEDVYPATPMQEALMAVSAHRAGAYHGQTVCKIPAKLDVHRLQKAWDTFVSSTPILRTRIVVVDELGPLQVVMQPSGPRWENHTSLKQYLEDDLARQFGYGIELCRFAIIHEKSKVDNSYFVWSAHHAIYDGWSQNLVFNEVQKIYNGSWQQSLVPYNSFIKHLNHFNMAEVDEFWRSQFPVTTETYPHVPSGYEPRPRQAMNKSLQMERRDKMITTATVIQAAWALVTARHTDNHEAALFGLTLSGRDAAVAGITKVMGPTMTTVPVRVALDYANKTARQYLYDVQDQVNLLRQYQHAGGLQRIRRVSPEARSAVDFQNVLVIDRAGELSDVGMGLEHIESQQGSFHDLALTIDCLIKEGALDVRVQYDNALISSRQMECLLYQFEHAMAVLERSENALLQDLDLASAHDLELMGVWNKGLVQEPVEWTVHELVEAQVRANPDALATSGFDAEYTYAQLDQTANALAAHLNDLGVGPEKRVVFCFKKSTWPIVAMLATLKSGGACVSVNPDQPTERLIEICNDTDATVLLCDASSVERFAPYVPCVVAVDSSLITRIGYRKDWTQPNVLPTNAAFVVYTSGSTGKPKGAVIEHRSVCTSSIANAKDMYIGNQTRAVQFAAYTFDASICEIFAPLIMGGCVCVISDEERVNNLAKAINTRNADWIMLTPTVAQLFTPADVPCLKTLIFGGEALSPKVLQTWIGDVQVVNYWGPSECSNSGCINTTMTANTNTMEIGRPNASRVWITNKGSPDQLAPIGAVGEILVEGPILAREYVKRPEATAAAFITDPLWSQSGLGAGSNYTLGRSRRFYRTGDLARFAPDGTVIFAGRADGQIKIHGQRVELGEIEHQVRKRLPTGKQVVIDFVASADGSNGKKVVAFVELEALLPNANAAVSEAAIGRETAFGCEVIDADTKHKLGARIAALERSLAETLPHYMIPSIFIPISFIPTTPSGKTDRKRLREYARGLRREAMYKRDGALEKRQPTTEMERKLQLVWAAVLNYTASEIGVDDTFASLGGDSISAMRAVAECRKMNIKVTVSSILSKKTIHSVAQLCVQKVFEAVAAADETDESSFDLAPIQKQYFEIESQDWTRYHQSFLLRVRRDVSLAQMQQAFNVVVNYHDMLRARFVQIDNEWKQKILPRGPETYRFKSHAACALSEVEGRARESIDGLDIVSGPVFTVDFFDIDNGDSMVFMAAHHLIMDLVSWRVIWGHIEEVLLHKTVSGSPTVSFRQWCELQKMNAEAQTSMQEVLPLSNLPNNTDFWRVPQEENLLSESVDESFSLSQEVTKLILDKSNNALGTTPLDILLGLLSLSFHKTFPERDVPTVHIEHHGREPWDNEEDIDVGQTVGWFTTTHPLQIPVTSSTTATEAVRKVKDMRHRVPANGRPYFACSKLSSQGIEEFAVHNPVEIVVNFAGVFQQIEVGDSLFEAESRVKISEPKDQVKGHRWAMIDLGIDVSRGVMNFSFGLHQRMAHMDRVKNWIHSYNGMIAEVAPMFAQQKLSYTLSDFPMLAFDYSELDRLMSKTLPQLGVNDLNNIESVYPCTAMQEGILLSQQKDNRTYQTQWVWEFVNLPFTYDTLYSKLERSWQALTTRHTTLRTGIVDDISGSGQFLQVVLKNFKPNLTAMTERATLQDTPKFKGDFWFHFPTLSLVHTENGKIIGRLSTSHALIDGESHDWLFNELFSGVFEESVSRAPAMQFDKFVQYERSVSKTQNVQYWSRYLENSQPCCIPPQQQYNFQEPEFGHYSVPKSVTQDLVGFCKRTGTTPAAVLHAAWAIVLAAFTGEPDVCFGYIASGRDAPIQNIERAVGIFLSMQICRVKATGSIPRMLQQIQDDIITGLEYRNCSLISVQRALGLGASPLFDTVLAVRRAEEGGEVSSTDRYISMYDVPEKTEYAITLNAFVKASSCEVGLVYQQARVPRDYAQSIFGSLEAAIQAITQSEVLTVDAVPLLGRRDQALLHQWNTHLPPTAETTVHQLFESQVIATPDAIATSGFDGEYTYAQINTMANSLAAYLVDLGVRAEMPVALCFRKATSAIIAMIAILKCGGVCVSVNPEHPASRVLGLCENLGASVMLCDRDIAAPFKDKLQHVLAVDLPWLEQLGRREFNAQAVLPSNAAFIVHTSGSTGKPKATVLEHRSVCTTLLIGSDRSSVTSKTRILQFGAYSFDIHIFEIFAPLSVGGCVCVMSDKERSDVTRALIDYKATWTFLTPSMADVLSPSDLPALETMVIGGEALMMRCAQKWLGKVNLIQAYGPSECSIFSSFYPMTEADPSTIANIGWPLGCRNWITMLGQPDKLAPLGCVGELLIEGSILGRHYVNQPEATADAYLSSLEWAVDGKGEARRFYRTGDLCKFNHDGSMLYISRADTQVKLRGQRIELTEVEYHMQELLPERSQIAVEMVTPDDGSSKILMAFVTLPPSDTSDTEAANAHVLSSLTASLDKALRERVPSYMVPSAYVPMHQMPLTISLKTDRKRLREIGATLTAKDLLQFRTSTEDAPMPSTTMEKKLAALWASVLEVEEGIINTQTNFFYLRGDSIVAMRLVAAARRESLRLTLSNVFAQPTLSAMAATMTALFDEEGVAYKPFSTVTTSFLEKRIRPQLARNQQEVEDVLPTTDFQAASIEAHQRKPAGLMLYLLSAFAEDIDVVCLERACQQLVDRHDALRSVFLTADQRYWQVVLRHVKVDVKVIDTSDDPRVFSKALCTKDLIDSEFGFGSSWLRFWVVRSPSQQSHLIMRISHAQYDGATLPVLLQDLQDLYHGNALEAPASFAQYMSTITHATKSDCIDYWHEVLQGSSISQLPAEANIEKSDNHRMTIIDHVTLPKCPTEITMSSLISVVYSRVISEITQNKDVIFGQMMTGRNVPVSNSDRVVGACINMIPLRVRLDDRVDLQTMARSLQRQRVESTKFEYCGLSTLLREHAIKASSSSPSEHDEFKWTLFHQNVGKIRTTTFKNELFAPDLPMLSDDHVQVDTEEKGDLLKIIIGGRRGREGLMRQVLERMKGLLAEV